MNAYTSEDYDHFVRVLLHRWEFALELKHEWSTFDGEERASYTEDWPVNNDIHQYLMDYVTAHGLTDDQKAQWSRLNKLVAEHTEDLEEMGYRVRRPNMGKDRAVA